MSKELRSGRLCVGTKKWWLLPGSNQRPVDYDSIALPTELCRSIYVNLIYPDSAKNQACFEEKTEKNRFSESEGRNEGEKRRLYRHYPAGIEPKNRETSGVP